MQYTYKGQEYIDHPSEIKLYHPKHEDILRKPKEDFTLKEAYTLLDGAVDTMRLDCEALIKQEIARQWGKTKTQLEADKDTNPYVINNCLIFLIGHHWEKTTLPIVLELLSQSEDFFEYNNLFDDSETRNQFPILYVLYALCAINPHQLQDFLLRSDVTERGKEIALVSLSMMGAYIYEAGLHDEIMESILKTTETLLDAYIADHETQRISNKSLLSHVVDVAVVAGLETLYDKIHPLYTKQWIDEDICDEEDAEDGLLNGGFKGEKLDLNPRDWLLPEPDTYYWEQEDGV